jgi:hypothetical protein
MSQNEYKEYEMYTIVSQLHNRIYYNKYCIFTLYVFGKHLCDTAQ